jgi:hypothetical protein
MKWMLVCLWLLGGALFAASGFVPSPNHCGQRTASIRTDDVPAAGKAPSEGAALLLASRKSEPNSQAGDEKPSAPDFVGSETNTAPTDDFGLPSWAQLLRGTPVHSGPSVSSDILGYAQTGSAMQLVERKDGWVRVVDPTTSRQGWIFDEHIVPTQSPMRLRTEEAADNQASSSTALSEIEQSKSSFKASNAQKKYAKKRWR